MINPFHYVPCADYACYLTLPGTLVLNGYTFVKRGFNPTTEQAQYIWQNIADR